MIKAIACSKDRLISVEVEQNEKSVLINFRSLYPQTEDFFTAAVFSRLSYLSSEEWKKIFGIEFGDLLEVQFWPSWKADNGSRVEPDVFFRFEECDVIVEAKRYDGAGQYNEQLLREAKTYEYMFFHDQKKVYLFAVGGVKCFSSDPTINSVELVLFEWQMLYEKISKADINKFIKDDLLLAFELHGIKNPLNLKEFYSEKYKHLYIQDVNFNKAFNYMLNSFSNEWSNIEIPNIKIQAQSSMEVLKWI